MGDGANDIPMLKAAGTGIAFNAKPRVQSEVSELLLRAYSPLFGYSRVILGSLLLEQHQYFPSPADPGPGGES